MAWAIFLRFLPHRLTCVTFRFFFQIFILNAAEVIKQSVILIDFLPSSLSSGTTWRDVFILFIYYVKGTNKQGNSLNHESATPGPRVTSLNVPQNFEGRNRKRNSVCCMDPLSPILHT